MNGATPWIVACAAMMPALLLLVTAAARAGIAERFVALQGATSLAVLLIAMLTFAIDQPSSIDLAVALALLGLPGSLVVAVFVERWL